MGSTYQRGKGFFFVGQVNLSPLAPGDAQGSVELLNYCGEKRPMRQVLVTSDGHQYMAPMDSLDVTVKDVQEPASSGGGGVRGRRTAVIGEDTRQIITDTSLHPFFYIGQLNYPGIGGGCTGTIVASRSIVTAGHCLYDTEKSSWLYPDTFAPGRYNLGRTAATMKDPYGLWEADYYFVTQTYFNTGEWDVDLGIVLYSDTFLVNDGPPDYSISTATVGDSWWLDQSEIVGYPGDTAPGSLWTTGRCLNGFFDAGTQTAAAHQCDTFAGKLSLCGRNIHNEPAVSLTHALKHFVPFSREKRHVWESSHDAR